MLIYLFLFPSVLLIKVRYLQPLLPWHGYDLHFRYDDSCRSWAPAIAASHPSLRPSAYLASEKRPNARHPNAAVTSTWPQELTGKARLNHRIPPSQLGDFLVADLICRKYVKQYKPWPKSHLKQTKSKWQLDSQHKKTHIAVSKTTISKPVTSLPPQKNEKP